MGFWPCSVVCCCNQSALGQHARLLRPDIAPYGRCRTDMIPMPMICNAGDDASNNGVVLVVEVYSLHPRMSRRGIALGGSRRARLSLNCISNFGESLWLRSLCVYLSR